MPSPTATISVERANKATGKAVALDVLLDGASIGSVANDTTEQFSVTPGQHQIYVINKFGNKSKICRFTINPGDTLPLLCWVGFPTVQLVPADDTDDARFSVTVMHHPPSVTKVIVGLFLGLITFAIVGIGVAIDGLINLHRIRKGTLTTSARKLALTQVFGGLLEFAGAILFHLTRNG